MFKLASNMGGPRIYLASALINLSLTKDLGPSLSNDTVWLLYSFNTYLLNISPAQDVVLDIVDPRTSTCDVTALVELTV